MYCNNCGEKCDQDSVYCIKCGHKLGTEVHNITISKKENQNKKPNKTLIILLIIFIVGFILTLIALMFMELDTPKKKEDDNTTTQASNSDGICDIEEIVGSDFSFAVKLGESSSAVRVLDESNKPVNVEITSDFDTTYVLSPKEGYKEGITYRIVLDNGVFLVDKYNKYSDICFRVKNNTPSIEEDKSFKIGTYKHKENYITLNSDNTFILGVLVNGELVTYKGTYKIENYVLTCNTVDENNNFGVFEFNINSEGDLTSLNNLGISNYSDIGTIYSYKG